MLEISICGSAIRDEIAFRMDDKHSHHGVILKKSSNPFLNTPSVLGGTIDRDEIIKLRDFLVQLLERTQ